MEYVYEIPRSAYEHLPPEERAEHIENLGYKLASDAVAARGGEFSWHSKLDGVIIITRGGTRGSEPIGRIQGTEASSMDDVRLDGFFAHYTF